MLAISKREIEKSKKDLLELHKRVLTDYLTREGIPYKTRKKFFKLYDYCITYDNIKLYFFCPCRIFVRALVKGKLELINWYHPLPNKKLRRHNKRKHPVTSF